MFCLREGVTYRVWFDKLTDRLELPRKRRAEHLQAAMASFVSLLEERLVQAPLQWYNFYDFWRPAGVPQPPGRGSGAGGGRPREGR
jgi:predicted LPLAT superfamily acyltransferase